MIWFDIRPAVLCYEKNVGCSCLDRRRPREYKSRREGKELEGACLRIDEEGKHQMMFCFQAGQRMLLLE